LTDAPFDLLFQPGRIGRLTTANRFVRSATAERLADNETGIPGPALAEMYYRLAAGEVGLIVAGHAYVDRAGKCHPEMTAIDRDEVVPHLKRLTDAAHAGGAKIALQINYGGAGCDPKVTPLRSAPSLVPDEGISGEDFRELAADEIPALAGRYAEAAVRARGAGYDAVQIHGAHGYLVSQFLSPLRNHRTDEWGGDIAGRSRFLREIGRAVRAAVGPDYPLFVKLGVRDYKEGGLTLEDGLWVVGQLKDWGFDAVEISHGVGGPESSARRNGSAEMEAPFFAFARAARAVTDLPLILVYGLRTAAAMREVLSTGAADFVSLCRPLIREPELPRRIRLGEREVAECRTCGRCWPSGLGEGSACRNTALLAQDRANVAR
jgi:2,4-dienoyl-CoA reductase-like NADH-dependent reductase (Old Yellow Enzyme family)